MLGLGARFRLDTVALLAKEAFRKVLQGWSDERPTSAWRMVRLAGVLEPMVTKTISLILPGQLFW